MDRVGAKAYIERYTFTDADLWGRDGGPTPEHIQQNQLGTCYILAAAGAVADRTPEVIRERVTFDASTQAFAVQMFDKGSWKTMRVSQEELRSNMLLRGGSNFDDRVLSEGVGKGGAIWPALYEVAHAKLKFGSWQAGLQEETKANGDKAKRIEGGQPGEMLTAITGKPSLRMPASELYAMSDSQIVKMVEARLASGQRITFNTNQQSLLEVVLPTARGNDGLAGSHAYTLLAARLDENGEAILKVRNPHGGTTAQTCWAHQRELRRWK